MSLGDPEPDAPIDAGTEPISAPSVTLHAHPTGDGETRRRSTETCDETLTEAQIIIPTETAVKNLAILIRTRPRTARTKRERTLT
jgi:hypothetical protein